MAFDLQKLHDEVTCTTAKCKAVAITLCDTMKRRDNGATVRNKRRASSIDCFTKHLQENISVTLKNVNSTKYFSYIRRQDVSQLTHTARLSQLKQPHTMYGQPAHMTIHNIASTFHN